MCIDGHFFVQHKNLTSLRIEVQTEEELHTQILMYKNSRKPI